VWGAATSSYQIEGAIAEDGRGPSIWDTFCATPGKVVNGDSGAVACDFYHRYPQDIELLRELGVDAFRFSIAWPRVVPDGRGAVNAAGLDFYDRVVDALLEAGIRPFPTLYHWDLPQPLEDAGGWRTRATAEAFAWYAQAIVRRLGDRIEDWTTHNEPFCTAWLGHVVGVHAPGLTDVGAGVAAVHHVLLSHGLAGEVIRRECPGARLGIVFDVWPVHPASGEPADAEAARKVDGVRNRLFLDPVLRGTYPDEVLDALGVAPPIEECDLDTIARPLDFVGVNNYSRTVARADADGAPPVTAVPNGVAVTATGWEIYPDALYEVLVRLHREYGVGSLYVTESGAAFDDRRGPDGRVDDPDRVSYLDAYVDAALRARADGVPLDGYFVWSLLDNFEWSEGYSKRFGIVYVDFETLERVPKSSFAWYRDRIARG
jgi:beta-glucosidase